MTKREAKREACRRAAQALRDATHDGWPTHFYARADGAKVAAALAEVIAELERRGTASTTPV